MSTQERNRTRPFGEPTEADVRVLAILIGALIATRLNIWAGDVAWWAIRHSAAGAGAALLFLLLVLLAVVVPSLRKRRSWESEGPD